MLVVEVDLLAGRYHAHVWGDSQFAMSGPEWPPSPWRLLRAVASAWFETRPVPSTIAERDALIEKLGCCPAPEMWLPTTAFRELRYYQRLEHKRALHHDLFAVPAGGRFYFVFDVALSDEERGLLDQLLRRLQYLGRAESRTGLRLPDDLTSPPRGFFSVVPRDRAGTGGWSPCRVLCASKERKFSASDLWTSRNVATGKKSKKIETAMDSLGAPVHLVDALLSDRKPVPDGAVWIEYAQPEGSVLHELPLVRAQRVPTPTSVDVTALVCRLCRRVPIPLRDTVAVARAYRDAAVRSFSAATGGAQSRMLSGREQDGSVERAHRHLFYLPQPLAGSSEISTMVVRVPSGMSLSQEELDALMSVERVSIHGNDRYPITVVPEHTGGGGSVASRRWKSLTPFLPPLRHRLGRTGTLPEQQVAAFISESCGVTPLRITAIPGPGGTGTRTPMRAHEYGAATDGSRSSRTWRFTNRLGHWFTIEFDSPTIVGTTLGADAHFGLGQFLAVEDGL
jgi:CRISPR-associated protein Csb2